jgi:hypothetical protein
MKTAMKELWEYIEANYHEEGFNILDAKQRSLELEKQQIIDAFDEGQEYEYQYHINNTPKFDSQTYFIETYGSKGSDECQFEPISKTTSVTICANCGKEKFLHNTTTSSQTTSDKWKEYQDWLNEVPEISDEDIEKRVKEVGAMGEYYKMGYRDAIIWYREQLKQKP